MSMQRGDRVTEHQFSETGDGTITIRITSERILEFDYDR